MAASDVIATNANPGDVDLSSIMGSLKDIGPAVQKLTNDWARLQAQNSDIAGSRFTLNNLSAQWNAMTPQSQAMLAAALCGVIYILVAKS